ncbi:MAG: ferritin-like domain-containing protein [Defluviicoccus sp.]|nr:ferritin-like domain-containing protein [Bryobacterales bacterium]MDE0277459.1 ferritin-like domain-containing protein [Defluviicoccus sp.]
MADFISFAVTVNGTVQLPQELPAHWRLLDYLHEELGLSGTKLGCGIGFCRACTVAVRASSEAPWKPVPACSTTLKVANGWELKTVESLACGGKLHPLQQAFIDDYAMQCGYCTPGFLMTGFCLLEEARTSGIDRSEIKARVDGAYESHLCRCTGYGRYKQSLLRVLDKVRVDPAIPRNSLEPSRDLGPHSRYGQPRWELIRLLHEAAEVEHSVMLMYLFAAFSLKRPHFASLAGHGQRRPRRPNNLLAIAIEEMVHLDVINRLLHELGAAPALTRQDFPFEPAIYPMRMSLEPASRITFAKYLIIESPPGALVEDKEVSKSLAPLMPVIEQVQPVGSMYRRIREVLAIAKQAEPDRVDWCRWDLELMGVQDEGETEHYEFFRSVLLGRHPALAGIDDPWSLPANDPRYPLVHSKVNPTAFLGHETTIAQPVARELAMLANRQYWLTMGLLRASYERGEALHPAARRHMAGPLLQLGWHLPAIYGEGIPFDPSPLRYGPGLNAGEQIEYLRALLADIRSDERRLAGFLPAAYNGQEADTESLLRTL